MTLSHWRDQDLEQLREVAGRVAAIVQTNPDRRGMLGRLAEAAEHRNAMADLLVDYSSRWFNEVNGQSILVGPELYWQLTEPDLTDERIPAGQGSGAEPGAAKRVRGMLLAYILESLARNQWMLEKPAEHEAPAEAANRKANIAVHALNTKVVTSGRTRG